MKHIATLTAITLIVTFMCGCGKKEDKHAKYMEEVFLRQKLEQEEQRRKDEERRRESENQQELRQQEQIARTEQARAEQKRQDAGRLEQERARGTAALKALQAAVVMDPTVHLSRSLAGKTTYEFRGPQLKEIRTLYASGKWGELAQLLDCSDSSDKSDLSEYAVQQLIRTLRSKPCFFLMKTSATLPQTEVSKSGIQITKGYHYL